MSATREGRKGVKAFSPGDLNLGIIIIIALVVKSGCEEGENKNNVNSCWKWMEKVGKCLSGPINEKLSLST